MHEVGGCMGQRHEQHRGSGSTPTCRKSSSSLAVGGRLLSTAGNNAKGQIRAIMMGKAAFIYSEKTGTPGSLYWMRPKDLVIELGACGPNSSARSTASAFAMFLLLFYRSGT